jgi:tetratricopeptide (TPR) repeat protein
MLAGVANAQDAAPPDAAVEPEVASETPSPDVAAPEAEAIEAVEPVATVEALAARPAPSLGELIDDGSERFERRDWVGAAEHFERARAIATEPDVLAALDYNIAVCLERAGAIDRAIAAWRGYGASPSLSDADRAEAERAAADLVAGSGVVEVRSGPAEVYLGEVLLGRAPGSVRALPGEIEIELRAPGHARAHRTVTVTSGVQVDVSITLVREDAALAEAGSRIARGEALFGQGSFDAALAEFEAAHELLEGGGDMYLALFNIALCHQRLGRVDLAVHYYGRYLEAAPSSEPGRAEVEATLRTLRDLLGTLVLDTNVDGVEVWVDGRLLGTAPGEIQIAGGLHDVELRAPGVEPTRFPLQLAAGQRIERTVELIPLPEGAGLGPEGFIASASITGAALISAAVVGGIFLGLLDAANARGEDGNTAADIDELERMALGADISFAIAGAAGIATIVLAAITDWDGGTPSHPVREVPTAMVIPLIGPNLAGLSVLGAF